MNSTNDLYDISDFIIQSIYGNSIVCDLGFGNTFLLNKIVERNENIKYVCVDKDVALCDKVTSFVRENNIKNVEVITKDITDFFEKTCNICVLSRIFHHFNQNDSEKIAELQASNDNLMKENALLKATSQVAKSEVKPEFLKFVTSEVMAMVNDTTDFETALKNYKKENTQYFGETVVKKVQSSPNLNGGGNKETTTNSIMNDILRGVRK